MTLNGNVPFGTHALIDNTVNKKVFLNLNEDNKVFLNLNEDNDSYYIRTINYCIYE